MHYVKSGEDKEYFDKLVALVKSNRCCASIIDKNVQYVSLKKWINLKVELLRDPVYNIATKINWILNDRTDFSTCRNPKCSNKVGIGKNIGVNSNYKAYCSMSCSTSDPVVLAKAKVTCLERHGSKSYRNPAKAKETCELKYNGQGFASKELRSKGIDTFKKAHDIDDDSIVNIGQIEEVKNKIRQKVGNKTTNPEFWQKHTNLRQTTCMERYGVRSYSQTHEFSKKIHHKSTYNDVVYDSSWEVKVAKYCTENNIDFEYQPNICFEYVVNGNRHYYFPDFRIRDKLYEVKGDQFIREDGSWFNPWNSEDDERQEARHKCCLEHDVVIISKRELNHLDDIIR